MYSGYEQQDALVLATYNAGTSIAKAARGAGGAAASWEAVSAELPKYFSSKKTQEIRTYVTQTRQWYTAWGGAGFIGTSYSTNQLGSYDVHLYAQEFVPEGFATVLARITRDIAACTTQDCVRARTLSVSRPDWMLVQSEPTTGTASVCGSIGEVAQLYAARQLQTCKDSPDTACTCPLQAQQIADYVLTSDALRISAANGASVGVSDIGVPAASGTAYALSADDVLPSGLGVAFAPQNGPLQLYDQGTLYMDGQSATLGLRHYSVGSDVATFPVNALRKDAHQLVFVQTNAPTCVLAPQPEFYCALDANNPTKHVLFAVDMRAHSQPQSTITLDSIEPPGLIIPGVDTFAKITFHATVPYRALHVLITEPPLIPSAQAPAIVFEDYLPFVEAAAHPEITDSALLDRAVAHDGVVLFDGEQYALYVPYHQGDQVTMAWVDENMRETRAAQAVMP
jgi:hypothetical protein